MQVLKVIRGVDKVAPLWALWGDKIKICGGYVRYMCSPCVSPAEAGDIDIYPNDMAAHESILQDLGKMGYKESFTSPVAVSFFTEHGPLEGVPKLQIIVPKNEGAIVADGTLEQIINSFDFTVVRIGLTSLSEALADDDFAKDELNKRLSIKNIHCPISSVKRIAKYTTKGYRIHPFQILKLYEDWDKRSPEYKQELTEGLGILASAENFWDVDEDTRGRIATLLYTD